MTTPTLTLADFLLARIAEDESEANYLRNVGVQGAQFGSVNGSLAHLIDRALAECEAKRQVVQHCQEAAKVMSDDRTAEWLGDDVVLFLAQPYAEHEDFREEWRA